jgi:hypothetical protein
LRRECPVAQSTFTRPQIGEPTCGEGLGSAFHRRQVVHSPRRIFVSVPAPGFTVEKLERGRRLFLALSFFWRLAGRPASQFAEEPVARQSPVPKKCACRPVAAGPVGNSLPSRHTPPQVIHEVEYERGVGRLCLFRLRDDDCVLAVGHQVETFYQCFVPRTGRRRRK